MFSTGDYIIYGTDGVCRVDDVGPADLHGMDKNTIYYHLSPVYRSGTILTPVDGKTKMRSIISRQELDRLVGLLPSLAPLEDIPANNRDAGEYYRDLLAQHDCGLLLRMCVTIRRKQEALSGKRKTLSSMELRNWRLAEELLFGEFGFVLGISPAGVKQYLLEKAGS